MMIGGNNVRRRVEQFWLVTVNRQNIGMHCNIFVDNMMYQLTICMMLMEHIENCMK
ncbi:unnamed protein product [Arabidopsis halleri]